MASKMANRSKEPSKQNSTIQSPQTPLSTSSHRIMANKTVLSGDAATEKARRDDLAERKKERKLLEDMLAMNDRGELSAEQTLALQAIFRKKDIPTTEEAIQQDKLDRENALVEMHAARISPLEKQKPSSSKEANERPDITKGSFVDIRKRQREQEAAEDAAYRDTMREYYKDKPFPEESGEWEDVQGLEGVRGVRDRGGGGVRIWS